MPLPFNLAFVFLYARLELVSFGVEAGEFTMMKPNKITVLASLFLGATAFGGISANAVPLSNMTTSVQPEMVTGNLVQKTGKKTRNLLLGLGAGALIGGAVVNNNNRAYNRGYNDANRRAVPRGYRRGRYEPWTDAWYDDCFRRYRSFNPDTGYYLAYSGRYNFCR